MLKHVTCFVLLGNVVRLYTADRGGVLSAQIRPVVQRVVPFEMVPDAFSQLMAGHSRGKTVIRVVDESPASSESSESSEESSESSEAESDAAPSDRRDA